MNKHYRHGDILLIKIDKLPENIRFKTKKSKVILKGEVTEHAHRLGGNAKILEVAEKIANRPLPPRIRDGRVLPYAGPITQKLLSLLADKQVIGYAVVKEPTELTHEEHNTITLPVGTYEIKRQREYDADYIRFVED